MHRKYLQGKTEGHLPTILGAGLWAKEDVDKK